MGCLRRVLRSGGLILLLLLTLAILGVPIQQQILGCRSERLPTDLRRLNLRESTWADAQQIFTRWGAWGHYDGSCTQRKCLYEISLGDLVNMHPYLIDRLQRVLPIYRFLSGRPSLIRAYVSVVDGVVWGKGFSVYVEVPPEKRVAATFGGYGYTLIGKSGSVSRFPPLRFRTAFIDHPNYLVRPPDGCSACKALFADFSPYADSNTVQKLMHFDLSCITRRDPCRTQADIMPDAWAEYLKD